MKKKINEIIPAALALILIAAILTVLLSIINQNNPPANSNPFIPVDEENDKNDENNNQEPEIEPYYTQFPKKAQASDVFLYEQDITGYGNTYIKNIHITTLGAFTIVETDAEFGDVKTDMQSVAIAEISTTGNINKIFLLPSRLPLTYLDSKITVDGIVIMCKNQQNILVYTVDYELNQSNTTSLPLNENGRVFNGSQGCVILTEGSQNTVYKSIDDQIITAFLPTGEIIEIFDFYFYLMIFINTQNGYSIVKLTPSLKITQNAFIAGSELKAITPLTENGEQMFYITEKTATGNYLWKYDSSFNKNTARLTSLGNIENLLLISHNNEIIAIYTQETKGIYKFNTNLDCALINNPVLQTITYVYDYTLYADGCYLLCSTAEGLKFINCSYDNNYITKNIDQKTQNAYFVLNPNKTATIFYEKIDQNQNVYVNIVCTTI